MPTVSTSTTALGVHLFESCVGDDTATDGSHRTEMEKLCFEFIRTDLRPYAFTHFSSQTAPGAPSSNSTNLVWSGSTCLPHRVLRVGLEGANHTEWVALPVSTLRTKENMLVSLRTAMAAPHQPPHYDPDLRSLPRLGCYRCRGLCALCNMRSLPPSFQKLRCGVVKLALPQRITSPEQMCCLRARFVRGEHHLPVVLNHSVTTVCLGDMHLRY